MRSTPARRGLIGSGDVEREFGLTRFACARLDAELIGPPEKAAVSSCRQGDKVGMMRGVREGFCEGFDGEGYGRRRDSLLRADGLRWSAACRRPWVGRDAS
jgi:hypothetical protein